LVAERFIKQNKNTKNSKIIKSDYANMSN